MSLETILTDLVARLRQGRLPNKQAISQGIVSRVLPELGWDNRPVAFNPHEGINDNTVQLHLQHRVLQCLLRRFLAQRLARHVLFLPA